MFRALRAECSRFCSAHLGLHEACLHEAVEDRVRQLHASRPQRLVAGGHNIRGAKWIQTLNSMGLICRYRSVAQVSGYAK